MPDAAPGKVSTLLGGSVATQTPLCAVWEDPTSPHPPRGGSNAEAGGLPGGHCHVCLKQNPGAHSELKLKRYSLPGEKPSTCEPFISWQEVSQAQTCPKS